ncbi:hypothetical protein PISMIDRAFT_13021 [Pisolithus microcarpus 441]|uniref:Uncharacterized protein n=1 Tax=Pisolithus microcarpus 441 TaxID=765257 RepID=A0A0C9Z2L7_9AGAM|nr:hypothetical protein PISMIDRAFT_13021 [Pisolithus microcarpus 441]
MDKRKLGLRQYKLEARDWVLAKQLCSILKVLRDATLYFLHDMPNLAMVLPAMDYINQMFVNGITDTDNLDSAIHAALGVAKRTLNHYYSVTDFSEFCTPCYKLKYFKTANWEDEWIQTA